MNKQQHLRQKLMALLLGVGVGASAPAIGEVSEVEANDFLNSAQQLSTAPDLSVARHGAEIKGAVSSTHKLRPDIDFYSFYATEGLKLTIEIKDTGTFNPVLTVVSPSAKVFAQKVPPESMLLTDLLLNETGTWAVVVTGHNIRIATPDATTIPGMLASGSSAWDPLTGSYRVVLTPALPEMVKIGIEIKPGSGDFAPINPKARGVVPVALLQAPDFNPFNIDVNSLRFGRTGEEKSLRRCADGGLDVDGDGDLDRVCTFENQAAGFSESSTMGHLKGRMTDGTEFGGQGFLKVAPVQGKQ